MKAKQHQSPNLTQCSRSGCFSTENLEACCICYKGCCEAHRDFLKLELELSSTRSLDDLRYSSRMLRHICLDCNEQIKLALQLENDATGRDRDTTLRPNFEEALKVIVDPLFLALAARGAPDRAVLEFSDNDGIWLFRVRKGPELIYSFKIYRTMPEGIWYLVDLDHTRTQITNDSSLLRHLATVLIWRYFDHRVAWQNCIFNQIDAKLAELTR